MPRQGDLVHMKRSWKIPLHDLVYPGLAEAALLEVVVRIVDQAYPDSILGVKWNGALAWVYERDTVEA